MKKDKIVHCLCGAEIQQSQALKAGWKRKGKVWVCSDCVKNPDKLLKLTGEKETVATVSESAKKTEEIASIKAVFLTYDGALHETKQQAEKHLSRINMRKKLSDLLNNPHYFSNEMLDKIIDNFAQIAQIINDGGKDATATDTSKGESI